MTFRNVRLIVMTLGLLAAASMAWAQDKPVNLIHSAKAATAYVLLPANKGSASAFCIDPAGYFVTNVHVVKDLLPGQKVSLVLNSGEDNESVIQAAPVQLDKEDDLALLRAEGFKTLTALPLGDCANLSETDQVTALGYPFGNMLALDKGGHPNISVNVARVSSLRRHEGKLQLIQLDSQLNPGNSGGPVIDASGKVVGIVSSGVLSAGINFAVPVDKLTAMLAKPQIMFDPPTIADSRRSDPLTLTIHTFSFAKPAPQLNLEVILSTPDGAERTFPAHSTGPNIWTVSVIPLPPQAAASHYPAIITFADSSMHCTVDDATLQLDGKSYNLSQISRLDTHDGSTTLTRLDGTSVEGTKLTIPMLKGNVGGQSIPVDANHAISLVLERNSGTPNVAYRIVAKARGTVLAEATGSLLGGPLAAAMASNSGPGVGTANVGPADYCTILLSPKLHDTLSLDTAQRNQCVDMNAKLDYMLERAVRLPTAGLSASSAMVARARIALDREGQAVQALLSPAQDQKFRGMFVDGVLRPIVIRPLQTAPRMPHMIGVHSAAGVQIVYTDIGKQPAPGQPDLLPPVASALPPDEPIPSSPPPPSEPPRLDRHRLTSGIRMDQLNWEERSALGTIHSVGDARRMLKDPDASMAIVGAYWLATAPVQDDLREDILVSLKPHLHEFDSKRRLTFVMAFDHWADVAHAPDLAAIVDSPAEVQGLTSHPSCWAVAVAGLVRLSPHLAREAVDHRISNFFFRVETTKALQPIADSDDPAHALAAELIEMLRTYRLGRLNH